MQMAHKLFVISVWSMCHISIPLAWLSFFSILSNTNEDAVWGENQ